MSRTVTHCDNTTIAEAWVAILGSPAPHGDTENRELPGVMAWKARPSLPSFKEIPVLVVRQTGPTPVPPYWVKQVGWGPKSEFIARLGLRYLSLHFVPQPDPASTRYKSYNETLLPSISTWLDAFAHAYINAEVPEVARVTFGYVNAFRFTVGDTDIEDYFNLAVGLSDQVAPSGVSALNAAFTFPSADERISVSISLNASVMGESLDVTTKVEATLTPEVSLTFSDTPALQTHIAAAKHCAKHFFFEMATEKTHRLMEAQYAE